ncbi:ribosomal protein S18-alanine N-acetyltransferase [Mycolicibacterium palauense]|uniref:ribosomal protein S18-alanine N-acetyltransferase n=1 Tax=Mycolicibacterium palauense TaxID=2034511 RepID=UPI000BFF03A3|nr:ribosomal protein S18-alanine N-acetyltransferase [Mycolicibacterium palauense]
MTGGPDREPGPETGPVVIDPLTGSDAEACAELERLLFAGDDPWPARAFREAVREAHHHYVAARADGRLVGYAGIARLGRRAPFEHEVHTIGVHPDFQGRGIGRRLLADLLGFADSAGPGGAVFLEVRTDNDSAIALYESVGFSRVGLRKRYYQGSGADAYTMRRES